MKKCLMCNQLTEDENTACPFCGSLELETVEEPSIPDTPETAKEQTTEKKVELPSYAEITENDSKSETDDALAADDNNPFLSQNMKVPEKKSKKGKFIVLGIIAAVLIALVVYIYIFMVIPSKPVKNMLETYYAGNLEGYYATVFPPNKDTVKAQIEQQYPTADKFKESISSSLSQSFGTDYKISTRVLDVSDVSETMKTKLKSEMKADDASKVTDMKYVTLKITISGSTMDDVSSATQLAVKYNGEWYIYQ